MRPFQHELSTSQDAGGSIGPVPPGTSMAVKEAVKVAVNVFEPICFETVRGEMAVALIPLQHVSTLQKPRYSFTHFTNLVW